MAVALWNNAQFQADLAALGFARANLIEAKMLPNPTLSILFPTGSKVLEADLTWAIDVLWQRPRRIAAAELDAEALSENLIEHGLGLIRDVQTTYADLWLAAERAGLAQKDAKLLAEMAELARQRLKAGDISELAASAAHVDSLRAADTAKRVSKEAALLRQELTAMLGLAPDDAAFEIIPPDVRPRSAVSVDELLRTAFAARPDLRAAELKIEAAGERLGWEKSKIYNLIAIIDGEEREDIGPGLAVDIPIFDQNKGKITRAEAELEQATRKYEAARQDIVLQVRQAQTRYTSAHEQFERWDGEIIPSLKTRAERVRKSFEVGQVSYLAVLQAERELVEAGIRRTELAADLHRSAAELNYCVGKKMI